MRLAYFSPLPPTPSGIADYSAELLPYLAKWADITVFCNRSDLIQKPLAGRFDIRSLEEYVPSRWQYDLALYHMGNNVHHELIYQYALRYPGMIVLHDLYLHHFIAHTTFVQGHSAAYSRELSYLSGSDSFFECREIRLGKREIPVEEHPLCNRLVDVSLGIIVHSRATGKEITSMRPERFLRVIPAPIARHQGISLRSELNLPDGTVIFASLGFVHEVKQIELALVQFANLRKIMPDIHYLFVGGNLGIVDLEQLIKDLDLEGAVTSTGYVEDLQTFMDWTETADIVINLRYPTLGETSAAALRAMAAGKPVVVFDHGWYAELPDDACVKVPPMDAQALGTAMHELARNPERRSTLGEQARRTALRDHDLTVVAEAYSEALTACARYVSFSKLGRLEDPN